MVVGEAAEPACVTDMAGRARACQGLVALVRQLLDPKAFT